MARDKYPDDFLIEFYDSAILVAEDQIFLFIVLSIDIKDVFASLCQLDLYIVRDVVKRDLVKPGDCSTRRFPRGSEFSLVYRVLSHRVLI
ncbi:MAG: hypothetical protein L0Y67_06070 [Gammaproteobacteria bacterium]|nr:hypothetical protein [Gammaproteobacteria bacterium]MCI0591153.1 hypothetical protein [Gammaproteobacteria bacterium]